MDLEALLPGDVLEEVLRRLPPRSLAACRCVCRALRALVDDRRMLRADLLPLKLAGIFIGVLWVPQFFARPVLPQVVHALDHLAITRLTETLWDCRNGLLLFHNVVVNPATRRWVRLPPRPSLLHNSLCYVSDYLVFDPTVSVHYEVYAIPSPFGDDGTSDWPPSPFIIDVLSSKTLQWEERSYLREGEAAGTVANMRTRRGHSHQRSALWRGALYVPCQRDFVTRYSSLFLIFF